MTEIRNGSFFIFVSSKTINPGSAYRSPVGTACTRSHKIPRHKFRTHVQEAVYIEVFRQDIQTLIQFFPSLWTYL